MTLEQEAAFRWFTERAQQGVRHVVDHRQALTGQDLSDWLLEEYTGEGKRVEKLMRNLMFSSREKRQEETTRFLAAFAANFLDRFGEATR